MIDIKRHGVFVRLFSTSILMQVLLSGSSLAVGLLLIRRTSDIEYGYYILVVNAVLLATQLQNAYIYPSLVSRITSKDCDAIGRSRFVGGLYREQRTVLLWLTGVLLMASIAAWVLGFISNRIFILLVSALAAGFLSMFREFFRITLLAYRRPDDVLRGDAVYVFILVAAAFLIIHFPSPTTLLVLSMGVAALIGGSLQRKSLSAHEKWDTQGEKNALKSIYSIGLWATAGAGIHWTFAQGYNYLAAGTLSVTAVATIGAIRTLIMPINLLSTGVGNFMFPTVSTWLQQHKTSVVLRRNALMAAGLVFLSLIYLLMLWIFRDWIFTNILKKEFENRDPLLLLWFAIAIFMLLRDQLMYILLSKQRFRIMSGLTLICAVVSLATSYYAMRAFGEVGALFGLLLGEIVNVVGLVLLSLREVSRESSGP